MHIDPKRLKAAMDVAGVSTAELARRNKITVSYAARIVSGASRLPRNPALRRKIANSLGVPIDWIEALEPSAA